MKEKKKKSVDALSKGPFLGRVSYWVFRVLFRAGRQLDRHFTLVGLFVLVAALFCGVLGMDTRRTVAYQAFSFFAALILWSMVLGFRFRGRFQARRSLPRYATAGQALEYRIRLTNLGPRPQEGLLLFEGLHSPMPEKAAFLSGMVPEGPPKNILDRLAGWSRFLALYRRARGADSLRGPVDRILPNDTVVVNQRIMPLRRGRVRFQAVVLARPDPLGLYCGLRSLKAPQDLLVLPKTYPLAHISLPGSRKHHAGGVALAANVGESEEFVSLRDYRPGDPLRHIHWKSFARTGKPVIKEFSEEYFVRQALVLDTFDATGGGHAFEEAVSVAASFASSSVTRETLLDLLFVGPRAYCVTAGRGIASADRHLEILATVRPCPDKPFEHLTRAVMDRAGLISGAVLVLLDWDEPRKELVRSLTASGVPVLALLLWDSNRAEPEPGPMAHAPHRFVVLDAANVEAGLAGLGKGAL